MATAPNGAIVAVSKITPFVVNPLIVMGDVMASTPRWTCRSWEFPRVSVAAAIDDPPRRLELGRRMREAADHHHGDAGGPGEPCEAARQADKELHVPEQT